MTRVHPKPCPTDDCGEDMTWEPPHDADPDVGAGPWHGGYCCSGCGRVEEREPPHDPRDD